MHNTNTYIHIHSIDVELVGWGGLEPGLLVPEGHDHDYESQFLQSKSEQLAQEYTMVIAITIVYYLITMFQANPDCLTQTVCRLRRSTSTSLKPDSGDISLWRNKCNKI